jgi:hypothetical protein
MQPPAGGELWPREESQKESQLIEEAAERHEKKRTEEFVGVVYSKEEESRLG